MQLLLFATTTAYVLATFFRIKEKVADCSLKSHSALSLFIGVACNSIMAFKIFTDGNNGFHYQTLFVIGALSLGICTIFIEKGLQESFFSIFTVPASIVFLFCSTFADGTLAGDHFTHKWFAIHLLLAILGECFFFIAAISSLTYLFVVRRLKKKNRLRAVFFFP
ncbi:MAG: hypothetical protein PHV05_04505, partial [Candidatus Riflebacteria bacterium]|nr:hypothetical protein [Candidatus Riflebacteria bacterium]